MFRSGSGAGNTNNSIGLYYSIAGSAYTLAGQGPSTASGISSSSSSATSMTSLGSAWATTPLSVGEGQTITFRLAAFQANTNALGGTTRFLGTGTQDLSLTGFLTSLNAPYAWIGGSGLWAVGSGGWDQGNWENGKVVNLSGGDLTIDAGGVTAGAVTVSGTTNTVLRGGTLAAAGLTKEGISQLEIANAGNTLTNGLTLNGGSVLASANGVLHGMVALAAGTTLNIGGTTNTVANFSALDAFLLGTGRLAGTSFSFSVGSGTNTVDAVLDGTSAGLTKTGAGVLRLTGANTYTGPTAVTGGVLETVGNERIHNTSILNPGTGSTIRLGGNETVGGLSASATSSSIDLGTNQLTIGGANLSNSFVGSISGAGTVTKVGTNIQTLDSINTFTGGMTLKAGALRLQASGSRTTNGDGSVVLASSSFGTGVLTLEGGRIYSSSLTNSTTPGRTIYPSVNIQGDFAFGLSNSLGQTGDLTISTNVTGAITTLLTNATITADSPVDWQQGISGAGFSLTKSGPSQLTMRGTNTLEAIQLSQGRLDMRGTSTVNTVTVASGAILGYGTTVAALGTAVINLQGGAALGQVAGIGITIDDRTLPNPINIQGDVTFGVGGFGNYLSGTIDLTGVTRTITLVNSTHLIGVVTNGGIVVDNDAGGAGSRSLNLYGDNQHEGGTTLKANAILGLGHARALGSGPLTLNGNISVTNHYTLAFTNRVEIGAHTLTFVNSLDLALEGEVTGTSGGGIIKTNSGVLTLRGPLNYPGNTTVQEGSLVVEKSSLTATLTATDISVVLSNAPAVGAYDVLPGPLTGTYPSSVVSVAGLPPQLTASFNTATGDLEIASVPAPANLSYGSTELSATNGVLMTTVTPTCDNSPTSYAIDPALPGGLNFSTADGSIGGTPNVASPRSLYTVTATNAGGNTQRTFYLTVAKANPSITAAPVASAITAGQALSSSTLNGGTASVSGTFAWTDSSIIPPVGTSSQSVTFTPSDTANYNTATASVNVTVTSAGPTFDDAYPGKALSEVAPNGLSYLVNYAFGGSSTNGPQLPVQITSDPSKLTLQAFVRTNDSTLTVVGEVGASLTNWDTNNPLAGTATADQSGAPAGTERREFTVNTNGSRMFLRLKATK